MELGRVRRAIGTPSVSSISPHVAIDPDLVTGCRVWFTYSMSGSEYLNLTVNYAALSIDKTWSTPTPISNSWNGNSAVFILNIAAAPNGNVIVAWSMSYNNREQGIQYRVLSETGWRPEMSIVYLNRLSDRFIRLVPEEMQGLLDVLRSCRFLLEDRFRCD